MEKSLVQVNNDVYNLYGHKWYTADDDPVALLRHESKAKLPWVLAKIKKHFPNTQDIQLLDVGCGGGFLSNALAKESIAVTGVDISEDSLRIAKEHDETSSVVYKPADAYHLPFANETYDVVTAMDFLEHVEDPEAVVKEISRVLKPGGIFVYHTFNRNLIAYLVIIKFVEWFVRNTPKHLHILKLFIKPKELKKFCSNNNIVVQEMTGLKPIFSSIPLKNYFTGIVPKSMKFELTKILLLSYMGYGIKAGKPVN